MTQAQHTPGPWRFAPIMRPPIGKGPHHPDANGNIFWGYSISGSSEQGAAILPTLGAAHNFPDAIEANARLMAAAPTLLKALQEIAAGSSVDGRWLDADGDECDETDEGARWEQYSGEDQDVWLQSVARIAQAAIEAATGAPTVDEPAPPPTTRPADGPYSPELAEAFRIGARELCNSDLGDRINVDHDARVEEYGEGDGGAIVHCTIFVSDGERATLAEECVTCSTSIETRLGPCDECGHIDEDDSEDGDCVHTFKEDEFGINVCTKCDVEGDLPGSTAP